MQKISSLELENATPMMAQYLQIKQDNSGCLLFYRMGDFYELFFDDAVKASKALDITLTKRGKHNGEDIPMCGVPISSHESYLSRLIKKGFKVAVCEQMEDPAEAKKRGSKSVVKRDVVRLITSGTITEDTLLDVRKNNYLASIAVFKDNIGISWVDVSTGDFFTQEIAGGSKDKKIAVAAALSRLDANEILVSENLLFRDSEFMPVFDDYKDILSILPPSRFNFDNARKRLENFFGVQTLDAFGGFTNAEIIAGGVLLDYIDITQKGKMPRLNKPFKVAKNEFMEIDAATRRNLELSTSLAGDGRGASLLSVIDKTVTGVGARLLAKYIAEPLTNPDKINNRLDMVEFFINAQNARQKLRAVFARCPDIERAVSRLSLGRGSPRDLAAIRDAVLKIPEIKKIVVDAEGEKNFLKPYQETIINLGFYDDLGKLLGKALTEELPLYARDGGFIAKGYSQKLDELKKLRDESRVLIAELQTKYIAETGVTTLKIKHNNVIGYYVEVPAKQAQKLIDTKNNNDDSSTVFLHRQTLVGNMRFSTVELSGLEDRIREAADKSLALEIEIFDALVADVLLRSAELAKTAAAIAVLDVSSSLAELAENMNYTRPAVDDSLDFEIVKGRHPVVEKALYDNNMGGFIANDSLLSNEGGRIWLLTGPNMAGKSTFLRQNALIAVLAQIGSFVPAEKTRIGVINKLFSRVGASDDLARGRSTFMVEMVETAAILNQADEHSFVILDEIGRGTATFDGLSIAWAVIEHLHDLNKSRALFATHYHELTNLSERLPQLSLRTMKVKEWQGDIIFMHEVGLGTADRSYGVHVAKIAGLPSAVIKRSEEVLTLLESRDYGTMASVAADILPLFASAKIRNIKPENVIEPSKLELEFMKLNPDDFSPREALDELYRLKKMMTDDK